MRPGRLRRLRRMRRARRLPRRGVLLLPSLFTVANIFCGFSAIIQAANGKYVLAAGLIVVASILDGLDGRVARITGGTSEFGLQFDSIADTVSFGVAPAYVMYIWALQPLHRLGWAASFLYVICAAARLARFNMQHAVSDNRYFIGLPTPPAAVALSGVVLFFQIPIADMRVSGAAGGLLAVMSLLMVSRMRYRSFKDLVLPPRRPYLAIIGMAAVLVVVVIEPALFVLVVGFIYVLSGPLALAGRRWRRRAGASRSPKPAGVVDATQTALPES